MPLVYSPKWIAGQTKIFSFLSPTICESSYELEHSLELANRKKKHQQIRQVPAGGGEPMSRRVMDIAWAKWRGQSNRETCQNCAKSPKYTKSLHRLKLHFISKVNQVTQPCRKGRNMAGHTLAADRQRGVTITEINLGWRNVTSPQLACHQVTSEWVTDFLPIIITCEGLSAFPLQKWSNYCLPIEIKTSILIKDD